MTANTRFYPNFRELIASGFVKKNRFEVENITHYVILVELREKSATYFKVIAGL
jgi:hypothetical protein